MQARHLFWVLMRDQVGPLLRAAGFRGSGQSWRLEHPSGNAALIRVQRSRWNTADSVQFTIRPGEVVYLGDFDAHFHVAELEQMAISTGRTRLRQGNLAHFFDGVTPPRLKPGTEVDLPQVAAVLRAAMPKTTVAPTLATFSPARFGTGRDLFGLQRICGGYYTGKAKPKS